MTLMSIPTASISIFYLQKSGEQIMLFASLIKKENRKGRNFNFLRKEK